jgi:hypothetical protein
MTLYRRPTFYVPPYNYCDRWCERCSIDKSRCLLYQTEMDERLHREIDGRGEPSADEALRRMSADVRQAIRLVEAQAKEMGLPLKEAGAAPAPRGAAAVEADPLVRDGAAIARAAMAFVREHGKEFPAEAEALRRMSTLPGPKAGRAATADVEGDELGRADAILQAQAAHRALAATLAAFESAGRRRPGLLDAYLELLALARRVMEEIEERWLRAPHPLLEAVEGDAWWGPLRDVTPTLKNLRR